MKSIFCFIAENEVIGGYSSNTVRGFIQGKIILDGMFHFTWSEGKVKGRGMVEGHGATLRGRWGTGEAEDDGGEFSGERARREK